MSEPIVIRRDEKGRWAPGYTANPLGRKSSSEREIVQAIRDAHPPQEVVNMMRTVWKNATEGQQASVKAQVSFMQMLLSYLAGKPPTMHIRMNSKFEDMLAALGSNEPVTIDSTTTDETQTEN